VLQQREKEEEKNDELQQREKEDEKNDVLEQGSVSFHRMDEAQGQKERGGKTHGMSVEKARRYNSFRFGSRVRRGKKGPVLLNLPR